MLGTAALKSLFTLNWALRGSGDVFKWIDAAFCFAKIWKWLLVWERQQMVRHTLPSLLPLKEYAEFVGYDPFGQIPKAYKWLLWRIVPHLKQHWYSLWIMQVPFITRQYATVLSLSIGASDLLLTHEGFWCLCCYNFLWASDLVLQVEHLLRIDKDYVRNPHILTVNWDGAWGNIKLFLSCTSQLGCHLFFSDSSGFCG